LFPDSDNYKDGVADKTIRDYIKKYIEDELGMSVNKTQGGRRTELTDEIDYDLQKKILRIYLHLS